MSGNRIQHETTERVKGDSGASSKHTGRALRRETKAGRQTHAVDSVSPVRSGASQSLPRATAPNHKDRAMTTRAILIWTEPNERDRRQCNILRNAEQQAQRIADRAGVSVAIEYADGSLRLAQPSTRKD